MTLALIVPSAGRPASAARLAAAVAGTVNPRFTRLYVVLDHDEPEDDAYRSRLAPYAGYAEIMTAPKPPRGVHGMVFPLNWACGVLAEDRDDFAFMGDDHLPRTKGWDERLVSSLGGRPGVAYGDDLFQREALPTAAVVSGDLVRILGYMAPAVLLHLFVDDFWKRLGAEAANYVYCPDVVIEHLHPQAGKAAPDLGYYAAGMNAQLMNDDYVRFQRFLADIWPADRRRLEAVLAKISP